MTAQEYFKSHGLSSETLKKFGVTSDSKKITIPVKDKNGIFLFNKYRHLDFDKNSEAPKFTYDKGALSAIFNIQASLTSNYVFITEGEPDAMRLCQEGLTAISPTSGAATWKDEWTLELLGKKVYIVYDSDPAGVEGAAKLLEKIQSAVVINLPKETKDICEYFQKYTLDDFRILVKKETEKDKITYEELCAVIDKWILLPDKNVIRVLLATLVSHFLSSDPLWMFLVAPPSGSKTEILSTISSLSFVHMLSDLTPQTLASGMVAKNDPSLLLKLKNNIIVMKDFTTILTMRNENRQEILSQLREIYDGRYTKAFGTGKVFDWQGRITLLAGVTTMIDTQSAIFQVMGERFVMYRIPQPDDRLVARKAIKAMGQEKAMRTELKEAMTKYFHSLHIPLAEEITIPEEIIDSLASLASFIVKARSGVIRDNWKREISYIPTPEAPARLAKQLGVFLKCMAIIDRRLEVTWEDYYMTLRVAFDVVPKNRMIHLLALCDKDYIKTTGVAQDTNYSRSGSEIILEDLVAVGILEVIRVGSGHPNEWKIGELSKEYFKEILPVVKDSLYSIFPKGSHYDPLIKEMTSVKEKGSSPELWVDDPLDE